MTDEAEIGAVKFSTDIWDEHKANIWLEKNGFKIKYYNKPPQYSCRHIYYLQKCPNKFRKNVLYQTIEDGVDFVWFFRKN